jgi:Delta7-sterol 5-desaturase
MTPDLQSACRVVRVLPEHGTGAANQRAMDPIALWHTAPLALLTLVTAANFALMYLAFAWLATWVTERLLPRLGIGRLIDTRARPVGQRRRETKLSIIAVCMFALWTPVVGGLDRAGVIHVDTDFELGFIVLELALLLVWNELHFYVVHRLLHTKWLYKHVHAVHHRSTVPSPFSTYAMHPIEALLLGSIMLPPMFFFDLHYNTLCLYPMASLALNTLGHCNYTIDGFLTKAARAHVEHHQKNTKSFGFVVGGLGK